MRFFETIVPIAASVKLVSAAISPEYHSLMWKAGDVNFWSPLGLNTTAYALESPAGAAPEALNKRGYPVQAQDEYLSCTVVTLGGELSGATLEAQLQHYRDVKDDVWSEEEFMECVHVQSSAGASCAVDASSVVAFIKQHGISHVFVADIFDVPANMTNVYKVSSPQMVPNGPVVVSTSSSGDVIGVTPAYSLHEDQFDAFMSGSFPNTSKSGSYITLHVSVPGSRVPALIVPSKIASAIEDMGPLAGLRFAVKDIFHVNGLKTSGGSRAYYQVYGPQNFTTQTVEKSLAGGAQLIGKTKTIAFALGAPQNGAEIDYLDPFNARGDGYQTTGGSSSGSGSAATAYSWLDFTIGSDTGGSVRFPARFGGLYGYKPTHGIFNLTGILVAIAEQDTPGFLTRSPSIFTKLGKWWAKDTSLSSAASSPLPTNLLFFADAPAQTQPAAASMISAFFADVSAALNMSTSSVNVTQSWMESGPAPNQTIAEYMQYVYSDQNSIQFYEQIGKDLDDKYAAYNNGSHFPADPMVNATWYDAQDPLVIARYPESQARRIAFADFWNTHVAKPSNTTCSASFFAHSLHIAPGMEKVTYSEPSVAAYYWNGVYTNYAGVPEIVLPIGQVKYMSPYTLREEWQPVTVAFAAAKGCDLKLFELVERLEGLGMLKETLAGKVAYETEEVW